MVCGDMNVGIRKMLQISEMAWPCTQVSYHHSFVSWYCILQYTDFCIVKLKIDQGNQKQP